MISEAEGLFAIQMYESAFQLDETFALAYATHSAVHSWLYESGLDRSEARLASAKVSVDRALAMDPDLPEGHGALGSLYANQGQGQRALEEYQIALRSQPSNADLHEAISINQQKLGLQEDSLASVRKAAELNPRLGRLACWTGGRLFTLREFGEALSQHERAIELTPDRSCPYVCTAEILVNSDGNTQRARRFLEQIPAVIGREAQNPINRTWVTIDMMDGRYQEAIDRLSEGTNDAYEWAGYYISKDQLLAQLYGFLEQPNLERTHYEAALELLEAGVEERPEDPRLHASLGVVYAGLGRREAAEREVQLARRLLRGERDGGYQLMALAQIYVMLGEYDAAVDELEGLLSIPSFFTANHLRLDPTWDPLRGHQRFQELLRPS